MYRGYRLFQIEVYTSLREMFYDVRISKTTFYADDFYIHFFVKLEY